MTRNQSSHRDSFGGRRSALVIDSDYSSRLSLVPKILTSQASPTTHDDSHLCSPRSRYSPETQSSSRSSHHRSSPRGDHLSPPASPLVEISEDRDRRFSNISQPRIRTSEARVPSNYQRLSSVPPSPRFTTPPESPFGVSPRPRAKILFYHKHDPHYGFTNFSNHPVIYKGKKYSTSEHLFQSFKFHGHRTGLAEHIRTCSERPSVAFSEARRFQPEVRHDWKNVNIGMMDIALELKFTQHSELKDELLATGNAELVEDSDKDAFWGIGADGKGRNELGKALERLREKLRSDRRLYQ